MDQSPLLAVAAAVQAHGIAPRNDFAALAERMPCNGAVAPVFVLSARPRVTWVRVLA